MATTVDTRGKPTEALALPMEGNRKFAWMLAATYVATILPNAAKLLIPVFDVGALVLLPLYALSPATPLIWTFLFVLALVQFGKKALWMLPAAPFAMLPIAAYFGLVYSY